MGDRGPRWAVGDRGPPWGDVGVAGVAGGDIMPLELPAITNHTGFLSRITNISFNN